MAESKKQARGRRSIDNRARTAINALLDVEKLLSEGETVEAQKRIDKWREVSGFNKPTETAESLLLDKIFKGR